MLCSVILALSCTLVIASSDEMGTCGDDDEVCKSDQASFMQFKEVLVDAHPHGLAHADHQVLPVKSSHSVSDVLKSSNSADFLDFQDENSEHMVSKTGHVQLRATEEDFNAVLLYLAQEIFGEPKETTTEAPKETTTEEAKETKETTTEALKEKKETTTEEKKETTTEVPKETTEATKETTTKAPKETTTEEKTETTTEKKKETTTEAPKETTTEEKKETTTEAPKETTTEEKKETTTEEKKETTTTEQTKETTTEETKETTEENKPQGNKTKKDHEFHFKKFCEAKWMSAPQKLMCMKLRPIYLGLKKVQLKNGLVTSGKGNNEDGNIFSDGKGITVGLYTKFVKGNMTICETGFGGGYGALYSLATCEKCNLYIFDDEANPYSKASADFLRAQFPGRLNMVWGDSQKTLPRFMKDKPAVKCDFVMIDGGRSYKVASADTLNFAKMISSPKTPVLQHDCPIKGFPDFVNSVCRAWHDMAAQKCVLKEHDLTGVSWGTLDAQECQNFVPKIQSGAQSIHMAGIVAFAIAVLTGAGI